MPSLAGSNGSNGGSYSITIAPSYSASFGLVQVKDRLIVDCPATFSSTSLTSVDLICNRASFTSLTVESLVASGQVADLSIGALTCTQGTISTLTSTSASITGCNVGTLSSTNAIFSSMTSSSANLTDANVTGVLMATATRVNLTSSIYPFHVRGAGGQIGTLLISTTNSTSTAVRAQIALDDTSRTFSLTNNGQMALAVDAAGRVGIATSSPQASHHVQGSAIISGTLTLAGALVQPTGIVQMYTGSTAPTGWLLCDGSLVNKTAYAALYTLLGSTYGVETVSQFYLPDMRGRSPLGVGAGSGLSARALGGSGGAETHTLSISEMPSHNHGGLTDWMNQNWSHSHSVNFNNSTNGSGMAQESGQGVVDGTYSTNSADINHKHSITSEGGGGGHNNMHPFLVMNFIIKT